MQAVDITLKRRMPIPKAPELKNICRIDIAASKRGTHETHGWQFKVMREGKQQTKFFADAIFGSKETALVAAQEHRDRQLNLVGDYAGLFISDTLSSSNSSGILGVHRSESISQDEIIEEVWQSSAPSAIAGRRRAKAFSIAAHGEKGALYKAVEERLEAVSALVGVPQYKSSEPAISRLVDTYLNILIYLEASDELESEYIMSVINSRTIASTDKFKTITGRVGQASFRDKLEKLWGGRCSVSAATVLLNASHIKPWDVATDAERLDPFNGLLLSPTYDKAFDRGLITFEDSGRMLISSKLVSNLRPLGISPNACIKSINALCYPYLEYHRQIVFQP